MIIDVQVSDGDRFPLPPICECKAKFCFLGGPSLRRRSLPSATLGNSLAETRRLSVQVSDGDRFPLPHLDWTPTWTGWESVQVSDGDRFPLPQAGLAGYHFVSLTSKSPTEIASICHDLWHVDEGAALRSSKSPTEIASLCHQASVSNTTTWAGASKSPTEIASLCHFRAVSISCAQIACPSLRRRSLPSATSLAKASWSRPVAVQVSDGDRFPLPPRC